MLSHQTGPDDRCLVLRHCQVVENAWNIGIEFFFDFRLRNPDLHRFVYETCGTCLEVKGVPLSQSEQSKWLKDLVRTYESPLLAYACRIVPREQAREIVQEAFLKIWKETPIAVKGREKQWLFLVVRNHAFDVLKKTKKDINDEAVLREHADPSLTVDQEFEEKELNSQLLKRMKRLSKQQEEVIKLKFIDGFGYKEISTITGHSTSYVGVLIHEAIKILKVEDEIRKDSPHGGRT